MIVTWFKMRISFCFKADTIKKNISQENVTQTSKLKIAFQVSVFLGEENSYIQKKKH